MNATEEKSGVIVLQHIVIKNYGPSYLAFIKNILTSPHAEMTLYGTCFDSLILALFCVDFFFQNSIPVIGEKEVSNNTANVRTRDNKVHGEHSIVKIIERFSELKASKCLDAEEKF